MYVRACMNLNVLLNFALIKRCPLCLLFCWLFFDGIINAHQQQQELLLAIGFPDLLPYFRNIHSSIDINTQNKKDKTNHKKEAEKKKVGKHSRSLIPHT
jgi:hypothetical protein